MSNLIEKALAHKLDRRTFLKWSAAASAGVTLSSKVGLVKAPEELPVEAASNGAIWVPVSCWHNCGGRCLLQARVEDGVVTRVRSDQTHPDSPDYPQQRACLRGRSQRMQVYGPDRLKYPMKRKNWEPETGGKRELRGRDEWERISWDEALDYIAAEEKRILDNYGPWSILKTGFGGVEHLNLLGGCLGSWGLVSVGAFPAPSIKMKGGQGGVNDRLDLRNSKLIVLFGSNPAWSSGGSPSYHYLQAKKAGAKIIFVDPFYNPSAVALADEWVPCRPSTDAALLLGIAFYMITNNLQDQEFLDKYTLGFDADHMPPGADPKDNYRDYVLGISDGVPKTPEWASKICGTSPRQIRQLAHQMATTKPMWMSSSWAPARTYLGEQYVQNLLAVGWMTGNVGISGGCVGDAGHIGAANEGAALVRSGYSGQIYVPNPIMGNFMEIFAGFPSKEKSYGPVWDELWDTVLNGEFMDYQTGDIRKVDVRMISNVGMAAPLNQIPNLRKGIQAFRKVEFVAASDYVLDTTAKYADIVLPVTTKWEKYGDIQSGNREVFFWGSQTSEPIYEAKHDEWVEVELGKRHGLDPDQIAIMDFKQLTFNAIAGAEVIKDDGSGYEKLVTITAADIEELGVQGEPQQGRISWQEFKEKGVYQVPRSPDDNFGHIAYKAFRDDPEANPIYTATGKLQFHSQQLTEYVEDFGWNTIPPIPKYQPVREGVEETYEDFDLGIKGEYPFQLVTIHYLRRSHATLDNVLWLREAFRQELFMNIKDGEELGLKHGDVAKISSRHGTVVRPVALSPRVMPGVVLLGEGAWANFDDDEEIDKAGATNTLNGTVGVGHGEQGWNSCIVKVEKYDGEYEWDYKWPQRIFFEDEEA
jgi:anaerobic dimethyl sulfoxide reductase subunit A